MESTAIGFWGGMALLISSFTGPGLTTSGSSCDRELDDVRFQGMGGEGTSVLYLAERSELTVCLGYPAPKNISTRLFSHRRETSCQTGRGHSGAHDRQYSAVHD
jgi:hypothetical protein